MPSILYIDWPCILISLIFLFFWYFWYTATWLLRKAQNIILLSLFNFIYIDLFEKWTLGLLKLQNYLNLKSEHGPKPKLIVGTKLNVIIPTLLTDLCRRWCLAAKGWISKCYDSLIIWASKYLEAIFLFALFI